MNQDSLVSVTYIGEMAQRPCFGRSLVGRVHRDAIERSRNRPALPPSELPTIHHSDLPEAPPGDPLSREWNTYRREVGRLLAEGQADRFVLIKGDEVLELFDSSDQARTAGLTTFLAEPFLVRPVRERDPWVRVRGDLVLWPF